MSADAFGVWTLVLQLSTYTAFLDFGIQTAVGRFVAHTTEIEDHTGRNRVISTSLSILIGAAIFALTAMTMLAWQLPRLFHELPPQFYSDARTALLIVGGAAALGLPASIFNGIFIGLQRNEVPAVIIGGSRLISAFLLIAVAYLGGDLVLMATVVATVNLLSYGVQYWACRKLALGIHVAATLISKQTAREIFSYCFSLSIWTFAGMLVTGLDITLVGIFDFQSVGYYTIAASLITFIMGLQSALFSTLIPEAAVLSARENAHQLGSMLIASTRYGLCILLLTGLPLVVAAESILTLWVGSTYAAHSAILLQILVIANIIRLALLPYAMMLIGTGQQRLVTVTPLAEGLSNLLVSVIAGATLGAIGVAIGTLVGAIVGVLCHIAINMPRTTGIAVDPARYLKDGLLRPTVCAIPFMMVYVALQLFETVPPHALLPLVGLAMLLSIVVFWRWGLEATEQHTIVTLLAYPLQALLRK
jgi:O-antigen/teichoic acid export membrane protein